MSSELKNPEVRARIAELIGDQRPFSWAEKVGISKGAFSRIWNEGTIPGPEHLKKIKEATGCSIDWILTGEGGLVLDGGGREEGASVWHHRQKEMLDYDQFALIPHYDVSFNGGTEIGNEGALVPIAFSHSWLRTMGLVASRLAMVVAKGDSMRPTIRDRDVLLIELRENKCCSDDIYDGVYVFRIGNQLIPMGLSVAPDGCIYVERTAGGHEHFAVTPDQIEDGEINIVGRVVWRGGRI